MSSNGSVVTPDGGELFDLGQGKLWAGFVLRSLKRHKKRAAIVFSAIVLLSTFSALAKPKQYYSYTRILARAEDLVGDSVTQNASRREPPALLAESEIKSQTNLERIVDDLNLVERYDVSEGKLASAKRAFFEKIFGKGDPNDKRREVINELRTKLAVTNDSSEQIKQIINVDLVWNDPVQTKEILDLVNKNYFATRRRADVEPAEIDKNILLKDLAAQSERIAEVREIVGIAEDDARPIPESSPLKNELFIESELLQRYTDAKLRLTAVESAFALRYSVVTPAETPIGPVSGSLKSLIAGLLAGSILAAIVTALTDLLRGRVVESWQVTKSMNLPLLAEIGRS